MGISPIQLIIAAVVILIRWIIGYIKKQEMFPAYGSIFRVAFGIITVTMAFGLIYHSIDYSSICALDDLLREGNTNLQYFFAGLALMKFSVEEIVKDFSQVCSVNTS